MQHIELNEIISEIKPIFQHVYPLKQINVKILQVLQQQRPKKMFLLSKYWNVNPSHWYFLKNDALQRGGNR